MEKFSNNVLVCFIVSVGFLSCFVTFLSTNNVLGVPDHLLVDSQPLA